MHYPQQTQYPQDLLRVSWRGASSRPPGLRISVWDVGPGHPAPADADPSAETGRGLTIIDALTHSNWGWWPTPRSGGKVVHATLIAPADGPRSSRSLTIFTK